MIRILCCFLSTLLMLSACAAPAPARPQVQVEAAWARPTSGSPMDGGSPTPEMQGNSSMAENGLSSAVYCVITNSGSQADTLTGVSSETARTAEMHETQVKNNVAEMMPVARVDVAAGGRTVFEPGGYHVMLSGLTRALKTGETLRLTLHFEKSGDIPLDVPIRLEP